MSKFRDITKEELKKRDQSGSVTIDGHKFLSLRVKFYDDEVSDAPSKDDEVAEPAKTTATASRKPAAIEKVAETAPSPEAELEMDGFVNDDNEMANRARSSEGRRGRRREATKSSDYDVDSRPDPPTDEEDVTYINQPRKAKKKNKKKQAGSSKRRRKSKKKVKKSQPKKSKYEDDSDFEDDSLSDSSDSFSYDEGTD